MILVDRQLKDLLSQGSDLLQNYCEKNIQSISYDLRTEAYDTSSGRSETCDLAPGEFVFVESREIIHLPNDIIGHVLLRNSLIRQGLQMESPVYQPGHKTRVYFRISNLSNNMISLSQADEIASMMFIRLDQSPERTYDGKFQNELNFRNMGE
ncbi:MAG: hypothetical protein LUE86_05750 [Clostridiales bacterium]|nr:hypothetical protein [Clostridiales bacterium]